MKLRIALPKLGIRNGFAGKLLRFCLWVFGGGALMGIVFVGSFYFAMRMAMSSTEVKVPDLAGMTLEEAKEVVAPLGLVLQKVEERNSPAVASGQILQQVPTSQALVRRGRKVKLIISLGGRVLEVPVVVGKASRAVEIELRQAGLIPGDEALTPSFHVPEGRVIAQVPPPLTPAVPNSRVHRLVSNGQPRPAWVMPDLTGVRREVVERWIDGAGFRRGAVRRVRMAGWPSGRVVGQLPLAGYPIRDKEIVEFTVAE